QTSQGIFSIRLRHQALRIGDIYKCRETRLIAGTYLGFSAVGGFEFHRRVLRDFSCAFERSLRLAELSRQILDCLIVTSLFRALIRGLDRLLRTYRENVEHGKRYRQTGGPVGPVRRQALSASKKFSGWVPAAATSVHGGLAIELRIVGAVENTHLRQRLFDARLRC